MRGWGSWLVVATLLSTMGTATAAICRVGNVEYPCEDPDAVPPPPEAWYERGDVQFGLAAIGLLGSAGAAAWGVLRVRQRRRTLTDYIVAVETTYAGSKTTPGEGVPKLVNLRLEVRARHERGRLEDAQFLELDKRIADYIARLRLLELDRRFHDLPAPLIGEIRRHVSDGAFSRAEAELIDLHAATHRLPEPTRIALADLLRSWVREDAPVQIEAPA